MTNNISELVSSLNSAASGRQDRQSLGRFNGRFGKITLATLNIPFKRIETQQYYGITGGTIGCPNPHICCMRITITSS